MRLWRDRICCLCALLLISTVTAWGQDSEAMRPTGVSPGPVRKAKAVTAKDKEDADVSPSPVRKAHTAKSSHTRSRRTRPKPEEEESTPAPTEYTPDGIPKTSAASVIVVDANTGKTLYEKNADQIRAPASTQKLLTALIVAERGFLDQPVTI